MHVSFQHVNCVLMTFCDHCATTNVVVQELMNEIMRKVMMEVYA